MFRNIVLAFLGFKVCDHIWDKYVMPIIENRKQNKNNVV